MTVKLEWLIFQYPGYMDSSENHHKVSFFWKIILQNLELLFKLENHIF